MMPIPAIIHRTWKTEQIPYEIYDRRWVESWTKYHPDWLAVLWTDARLRELGRARYPEFEAMYSENVPGIFLADFGRYMVLHRFGGLYVDLDYECLRNVEPLIAGHGFVTSYSGDTTEELNNAFIAAAPGHPLLHRLMSACRERWIRSAHRLGTADFFPEPVTGPEMMTEVAREYLKDGGEPFKVHEARLLCPVDWRKGSSIELATLSPEVIARVREDYPDAYAATYWTHVRDNVP